MMKIKISIEDEAARKVLYAYLNKAIDLKEELSEIDKFIKSKIHEHFEKELGSEGIWKQSLRAKKDGGKTLTFSKDLRNSFQKKSASIISKISLEIQSDVIYAAIHQFGGPVTFTKTKRQIFMTKRDYIWFSSDDTKHIEQIIIKGFKNVA